MAAVGAVTKVPLVPGCRHAYLVIVCVRRRAVSRAGLGVCFPEWPVEIRVGDSTKVIFYGGRNLGQYQFWVLKPFIVGIPGIQECASIERLSVCPEGAAYRSAELMAREDRQRELPGLRDWWQSRL